MGSNKPTTSESRRRVTIHFEDDAIRRQAEATAQRLLSAATSNAIGADNSTMLAKKALKYRNVLTRMADVDVTSPGFDAAKFLGIDWCKTDSLKAYCSRDE